MLKKIELLSRNSILTNDELAQFQAILQDSSLWNEYTHRTRDSSSPHNGLSDIWVRFAPIKTFLSGRYDPSKPFDREYYPVAERLQPYLSKVVDHTYKKVDGIELGVILITKITPAVQCKPHVDRGWAPNYFSKYAFSIQANADQQFSVKNDADGYDRLTTQPGDLFYFNNTCLHHVDNNSTEDRITLIITIKTERGVHVP